MQRFFVSLNRTEEKPLKKKQDTARNVCDEVWCFYFSFSLFICLTFLVILYRVLPVLRAQQPKGNTVRWTINAKTKEIHFLQSGNTDGPSSVVSNCYTFQPFSVNQGCDFLQNATSSSSTPFGYPRRQLLHTTKNFLWIVLFKCHVFTVWIFPLLCLKTKTVYLRLLQGWVFKDAAVCETALLLFRHLVHSPKGNILVPRCMANQRGRTFTNQKQSTCTVCVKLSTWYTC